MENIEEVFDLNLNPDKKVDKIIQDDNLDYIHMRIQKNDGLPVHISNSNVYMTVLQGTLTIGLDDQDLQVYPSGSLLKIPYKTQMNVKNLHDEILELIVIKAPSPRSYKN
jgi:quercetin dioxygenase-like cupin family protein